LWDLFSSERIDEVSLTVIMIEDRKHKILIADDEKLIVETLIRVFEQYGYDSHGIYNNFDFGQEIMEQIHTGTYDLFLTDINRPCISGLELTKKIRSEGFDIPIIIITGYGIPTNILDAMRSGADDLLVKPFTIEILKVSIDRILRQRHTKQWRNLTADNLSPKGIHFNDISSPLEGSLREYYETSELMAELNYRDGKLDHINKIFRRDGNLLFNSDIKGLKPLSAQ
jgi:DNA-binding response OmpR family regulator